MQMHPGTTFRPSGNKLRSLRQPPRQDRLRHEEPLSGDVLCRGIPGRCFAVQRPGLSAEAVLPPRPVEKPSSQRGCRLALPGSFPGALLAGIPVNPVFVKSALATCGSLRFPFPV